MTNRLKAILYVLVLTITDQNPQDLTDETKHKFEY